MHIEIAATDDEVRAQGSFPVVTAFGRRPAHSRLAIKATYAKPLAILPDICGRMAELHDRRRAATDWPGYLRLRNGIDPGYHA